MRFEIAAARARHVAEHDQRAIARRLAELARGAVDRLVEARIVAEQRARAGAFGHLGDGGIRRHDADRVESAHAAQRRDHVFEHRQRESLRAVAAEGLGEARLSGCEMFHGDDRSGHERNS